MHDLSKRLTALAVTGAVLLSGCNRTATSDSSSASAERKLVKLSIWCSDEEQDIVVRLCESYARAHPEKKFAFTLGGMSDSEAVAQVIADKKQAADIFCFSSDDLDELISVGALLEITDRASAVQSSTTDSVQAAESSGKLYGLPFSADTPILYYDRSKLNEKDITSLDTILDKTISDTEITLAMDIYNGRQQSGFFSGAGCDLFGNSCSFNGENGLVAGEYLLEMVRNENLAPHYDEVSIKAGFAHGRIAAGIAGLEIADEIKSSLGNRFGAAALPNFTLPDGRTAQLGGAAEYRIAGVSALTSAKDDALEFARLLTGTDAQLQRLEKLGMMPVSKVLVTDSEILKEHPELKALTEQLKYSSQPLYKGFMKCAGDFAEELINGKITHNNLRERLNRFAELSIVNG